MNKRIDEFKLNNPDLKFSHLDFPDNWRGEWDKVRIYFENSKNYFELNEFAVKSKIRNLFEELLSKIYGDMIDNIFDENND